MWRIIIIVMGLFFSAAQAAVDLPKSCISSGYQFSKNLLILHPEKTTKPLLYLFYNKSSNSLWVSHPHGDRGVEAGWSSRLAAGNVSAFLVNRPNFLISCLNTTNQKRENCKKLLRVCLYKNVNIKNKQMIGTFWIAEDKPLKEVNKALQARGISVK